MTRIWAAIVLGTALLIGAVSGFIILPTHKPGQSCPPGVQVCVTTVPTGLSQTVYDALRITT